MFGVPALQGFPAMLTLGVLLFLYSPPSIFLSACLSYMFDKMDSALSFLPNIVTLLGIVPFVFVIAVDLIGSGEFFFFYPVFSAKKVHL